MSEQQQNGSQEGKSEAQAFFEHFSIANDSGATPEQEAVYAQSKAFDDMRAHEQFGTTRHLRVPDGDITKAHFRTTHQAPARSRSRSHSSRQQSRVQHGRWHDTPVSYSATYAGQRNSSSQPFAKGREGYDGPGWAEWFLKFLGLA